MRRPFVKLHLIVIAGLALPSECSVAAYLAQSQQESGSAIPTAEESLKMFLQGYLRGPSLRHDNTTRYSVAFVDLNGNGTSEAIVYVTGQRWCGSGGCLTLILTRRDSSYRVVTRVPITRPPIRVLPRASNGWHDIGVWVQGGESSRATKRSFALMAGRIQTILPFLLPNR